MGRHTYSTVDKYIDWQPEELRPILQKVRRIIHDAAPNAEERISYRMPCFWQGEPLIYFAAMKNHLVIYPTVSGMTAFRDCLSDYKTSKGAVQFPYSKPIPYDLIAEMTRFRVSENGR